MSTQSTIKPKGLINTPQRPMGPMGRGPMVMGVQKARDFKGTVRKLFGQSKQANSVHASDSLASADREVKLFFGVAALSR